MRAEEQKQIDENLSAEKSDDVLLKSHDWSQTPLGAIETWSADLKTAVQRRLTELNSAQTELGQPESMPSQNGNLITLRHAEADAFRIALSDALRLLTDANDIQATAARMLGEFLGASRVIYVEVLPGGDEVIVHKNYTNGVAELSGRYRLEDFGRNLIEDHRSGRSVIVPDVANSFRYTESEKAMYRAIDIAAHADVPLIKNDRFVALLAVHQATPREWTELEVQQVEETAERTWAAVERACAEVALRESEAKYRTLFESIDEGFCTVEVLFDADGKPVDHRILQANPAFERQSGIANPEGKTASELAPGVEQCWNDLYAQVIHTGKSIRTEIRSDALDRWFDVLVSRVGDAALHQVAIVFTDISKRKRAEATLQQTSAELERQVRKFDAIAASVPDFIYTFDLSGRFTYISRSLLDLWQKTSAEAMGKNFFELDYPGDLAARLQNQIQQVIETRQPLKDETPYTSAVGTRAYEYIFVPMFDVSGAVEAVAGVTRDITDRKRAEAALRESEQRFRLMADAVPQIVWITDAEGRVEFFNKQWSDYTGFPYEQTTAAEVAANLVHPDDGTLTIEAFEQARRSGDVFSVEHRIRSAAGAYRWFLVRAEPYRDLQTGEIVRWFGASVDIHDRKLTEAALRESEELKQSILDSSKDCIKVLTLNSEIVYITTGGLRLLEVDDPTAVLNASWVDFWQGEDYENARMAIAAAKAGSSGQFRGYLSTWKGTPKWWDSIITPVRNSAGAVTQLVAISRDITRQKQAETEREHLLSQEQAAREAAETANRIKDEFLAVLSHELRSPLNPILGWTRLLQNGKLNAARQSDALKTIERNAKLQSQLIEDLLDISRIMQGKLTLTATSVSLPFLISAAIETVQLAADAKQIEILLDFDPAIQPILGDAARLQQVVWNLLTNAVKFTPNGGQVMIELSQAQHAQLRVTDTGKGIQPQFLPYVFEYFRQEDGSTTRKFGGLGLGLAIVRQIVELHGGTVLAESDGENQGATFIVQLPTHSQEMPIDSEPARTQADSEMHLENVRILLVDDDTDTREFEAFLLEQHGAEVVATASGLEALQVLDQWIPDVIVSDIGMAEVDGYTLMQQIRSREALRNNSRSPSQGGKIPAIALTAYAAEVDRERAMQTGFQLHLTKPLEPEQFVIAIMSLLNSD